MIVVAVSRAWWVFAVRVSAVVGVAGVGVANRRTRVWLCEALPSREDDC